MIVNMEPRFVNRDVYGDKSVVTAYQPDEGEKKGFVHLRIEDGNGTAAHILKPKQARQLATSLLVAANIAGVVMAESDEEV